MTTIFNTEKFSIIKILVMKFFTNTDSYNRGSGNFSEDNHVLSRESCWENHWQLSLVSQNLVVENFPKDLTLLNSLATNLTRTNFVDTFNLKPTKFLNLSTLTKFVNANKFMKFVTNYKALFSLYILKPCRVY